MNWTAISLVVAALLFAVFCVGLAVVGSRGKSARFRAALWTLCLCLLGGVLWFGAGVSGAIRVSAFAPGWEHQCLPDWLGGSLVSLS